MNPRCYLTPGGLARLRARLDAARAAYKAVCDDNPAALESGDTSGWHDNFAFEENQRQMHQLARLVRELEQVLGTVTVVPAPAVAPDRVRLGAGVAWRFLEDTTVRQGWLAGWNDGDPSVGRVSYNSPLGAAFLGAEPGEEREVQLAEGLRHVEVVDVLPGPVEERG